MIKYVDTLIGFSEVPDEISLCINISNCPNKCKKCHSSYLAEDIGTPLTTQELHSLIESNKGITCICLLGGDAEPLYIDFLAEFIKSKYKDIKVAWYSGKDYLYDKLDLRNFDYIKVGSYQENKGALNCPNTNQKFYKVISGDSIKFEDITYKFQKDATN